MKITEQEVKYVADLANLQLGADEIARMARDLDGILSHIDKLNELDVTGVEPMAQVLYEAGETATLREDVIEPSLRATAMALYFAAMYVFGGALGPTVIGQLSDHYANQAAVEDGLDLTSLDAAGKLPYRAEGLNGAMYALPIASMLLAGSLFAGARTVNRDVENLQRWMREQTAGDSTAVKREKVAT